MYVCICNGVTDHEIRQAAEHGCSGMPELTMRTGCGSTCGSCIDMATDLLHAGRCALEARRADAAAVDAALPPRRIPHAA